MGEGKEKESRRVVRRRGREREAEGVRREGEKRGEKEEEGATLPCRQVCLGAGSSIVSFPRNFHLSGSQGLEERRFGGARLLFGDPIVVASLCDARVSSLPVPWRLFGFATR